MTLQDIYEQLSFGELRQLFMGNDPADPLAGMPEASFKKLLPTIQLGLTDLHTRFFLREGVSMVPLEANKVSYIVAATDFLRTERVYGTYQGEILPLVLNDLNDPASIRTPNLKTLVIPSDPEKAKWLSDTQSLEVVYRAEHPKINVHVANAAPMATPIDLPSTHLQALLLFIASRVYNPIGMTPGAMHEGNNYAAKYEHACQILENHGFEIQDSDEGDNIQQEGWV